MTEEQQKIIGDTKVKKADGWNYIKVEGTPYERGFKEGYLLADEYMDALRVYKYMTYETYGIEYDWFKEQSVKMHADMIPDDIKEELQGMADGLTAAGCPQTLEDLIAWNDWMEITGYWWVKEGPNYAGRPIRVHKSSHCSAIIATGSATIDGKPVFGHQSFDEFWAGQYFNVCKAVVPDKGNSFIMQAAGPCMITSMTDFYVTSAGLGITETTLAGFIGYDEKGMPEWVRARKAVQFGNNIDEFVSIINDGNNGGYANAWLIADTNTSEIARYEQGLVYQALERTNDGCFFGCNAVFDPRIRNLECKDNCFYDPRQQTGARRQRWMELIDLYSGKMNTDIVKKMLADTYDVYLGYENPSSRCICGHYDVDPQYYADNPNAVWNIPFYPAGSCDGKAADTDDIKNMRMWGRFGRADGIEFDADDFIRRHPLWGNMKGYLKSRPSQDWTLFSAQD